MQYICIHSCNTFTTIHLHSTHLSYLLPFISTERESDDTHTHTHTAVILFKSLLYVFHVANNLVNVILVGRGSCCLRGGWSKKYTNQHMRTFIICVNLLAINLCASEYRSDWQISAFINRSINSLFTAEIWMNIREM